MQKCLVLLLLLITPCITGVEYEPAQQESSPVILLTGYEPFGGRTENISWDAVKHLKNKKIGTYRIVVMQLPVVWGKPMPLLTEAIKKHKPVAVFSFGQGAPGAFTFESVGRNERKAYKDNKGERPKKKLIVEGGPERYFSTMGTKALSAALLKMKIPFKVSENAGQYLCDECTYSLMHLQKQLQKQHKLKATAFFHIPPLQSLITIKDEQVKLTKQHARTFVETVVSTWVQSVAEEDDTEEKP